MRPLGNGILWPSDHIQVRDLLEATFTDHLAAYLPTSSVCPVCGYNDFTRSGLDPSCTTCHGSGLVVTWQHAHFHCRAAWVDPAVLHPHSGLNAGEIGDAQIQAHLRDQRLFEQVRDSELGYIEFDGRRLKPTSITANRVEQLTTLDVRCHIVPRDGGGLA